MRRPPELTCAVAFALALAVAACSSGEPAPGPTGSTAPSAPSPSPTAAPSATTGPATGPSGAPTPLPQPDVRLPDGMSTIVDDPADVTAISAGDLTPLVPPGSTPATSANLARPQAPIDQIAVTWRAGEPPAGRTGLIVWQRAPGDPAWRAVYAFTDPPGRGVFGVRMDQGDLTGDGIADLLSFEDQGGSGACGTFRVVASTDGDATEILRRSVCDSEIQIAGGDLRMREAVFEPDDPHCCPSAFRTTVLRWTGSDWEEVSSEVSAAPGTG
jgi:hypothetical protein